MRILQVAPYFPPYLGGQENYIYNLSKKLVERGHEVHVLTSNYPKTISNEIMDGISIERKNIIFRPLRNPISWGTFSVGKISDQFDVVHMHNLYAFSSLVTAYHKKKLDFPLVLTCHGKLDFGANYKDMIVNFYSEQIAYKVMENVNVITLLSSTQGKYMVSNFPKISGKIKIVPNAIDINFFEEYDTNNDLKSKTPFTFLYVGQLIKRKGLKWLIRAFKIVNHENSNVKLILVGDGDHRGYFERMVNDYGLNDKIDFMGRIDDKSIIADIYKTSDVFVLPSLSEGLPTVILEAMFFRLPVIATNIMGIKEHFEDYANLVPPMNDKELADAMIKMCDKNNLSNYQKKSIKFKEVIKTSYSWEYVAKQFEKIYLKLI